MKKISVFLLTLVAGLALVSCGKKDSKSTQAPAPAPTPTPTPTPETKTYKSDSYEVISEKLDGKFAIGVTLCDKPTGSTEYITMDATLAVDEDNRIFFMASPEGKMFIRNYDMFDDYDIIYEYNTVSESYTKLYIEPTQMTDYIIDVEEALAVACGLDITYVTKEENFTFINRTCTRYENTYKEGTANITEQYIIDNATGLCLKHSYNSSATPGVETLKDDSFEVKSFYLGNDVDTECFAAEEARIEVIPWDAGFLNDNGFDEVTGYQFDLGEIYEKSVDDGYTYDLMVYDASKSPDGNGHFYKHETTIVLESTVEDEDNILFVESIIENLAHCGAKYDENGDQIELTTEKIKEATTYVYDDTEPDKLVSISYYAFTDDQQIHHFKLDYATDNLYNRAYIHISLVNSDLAPN